MAEMPWLVFLMLGYISCAAVKDEKELFFRSDYVLHQKLDAFYKFHKTKQNFSDAVAVCSAEGAQLFWPTSALESQIVYRNFVPKTVPLVWIGIHDLYSEGTFVTLDGKPIDKVYSNWKSGEPNNNNENEDCVVLGDDDSFNDGTCQSKENFICKRTIENLTHNAICETYDLGYVYSPAIKRCYKTHSYPMNWRNAYKTCIREDAGLVIVNNQEEADFLILEMAKYPENKINGSFNKNNFHVGFNDIINNGIYITTEGQLLSETGYNNWSIGQPDNAHGSEHCGTMLRDGTLNDFNCDYAAMFICEKRLSKKVNDVVERIADSVPQLVTSKPTTEPNTVYNLPGQLVPLPDAN